MAVIRLRWEATARRLKQSEGNTMKVVVMFQRRFVDAIQKGVKTQTIRLFRKGRAIQPGDILSLRVWKGKARRSKQRIIREAVCLRTWKIGIGDGYVVIGETQRIAGSANFQSANLNPFARRDGFRDWEEMREWFEKIHGLPFSGVLIEW